MSKPKEIAMVKTGDVWKPSRMDGQQWSADFVDGEEHWFKPIKVRNLGHHRKLFALLKFTRFNSPVCSHEMFPNEEALLKEVKLLTGHFTERYRLDGTTWPEPNSIAFDKMDQEEFQEFYNSALDVIWLKFFEGVEREALLEELTNFG